ncbi:MAG: hypothetical protein V1704_03070 [Candidatus Vogelbacteria bacterium]
MKIRNFVLVGLLTLVFVLSPVATNAQATTDNLIGQVVSSCSGITCPLFGQIMKLQAQINVLLKPCQQPGAVYNHQTGQLCNRRVPTPLPSLVPIYDNMMLSQDGMPDNIPAPPPTPSPIPPINNIVSPLPTPTPSITLASPNGGERWLRNAYQQITWTATGPAAMVEIWLNPVNVATVATPYLIGRTTTVAASYTWAGTINAPNGFVAVPSGAYKVQLRILGANNSVLASDTSNATFTIYENASMVPAPSPSLLPPPPPTPPPPSPLEPVSSPTDTINSMIMSDQIKLANALASLQLLIQQLQALQP